MVIFFNLRLILAVIVSKILKPNAEREKKKNQMGGGGEELRKKKKRERERNEK
jgi:hypothetical protein